MSNIFRERLVLFGLFSFLVIASISNVVTTVQSHVIGSAVKYFFSASTLLCICLLLIFDRINNKQVIAVALFVLAIFYASFLSALNSVANPEFNSLALDFVFVLSGLFLVGKYDSRIFPDSLAKYYLCYSLVVIFFTFMIGGLDFGFPPKFNFEYASAEIGREENYSLGISSFFGFSALAAVFLATETKKKIETILYLFLLIIFLLFSLLGGGRGESILAIFVVFLVVFVRKSAWLFIGFPLICLSVFFLVDDWSALMDGFVLFQRLSVLVDGDLSARDILLYQTLDLVAREPICLIFGCGVGFFQYYFGYDSGMYPHNSIAEALIVFGLPLVSVVALMVAAGVLIYFKKIKRVDLFLIFSTYALLVSLKSGYLFGSWLLLLSAFYFASASLVCLIRFVCEFLKGRSGLVVDNIR